MTRKQFGTLLLCFVMLLSFSAYATDTSVRPAERIKFSATSINLPANVSFMNDEIYKKIDELFNFEYDLINITWETWAERDRIWINAGDMPDMLFWDFNLKDYNSYKDQGLIKPLPVDYKEKFPNLAEAMRKTGVADYLQANDPDNLLYMIPNVIYLQPPTETTDLIISPRVIYYRKDWAEKVGITVGDTMTIEQLVELGKAFVEQDPEGNGTGKTIGLSAAQGGVNSIVQAYNSSYNIFHKDETGKYVWGGFEDSTLEGVKRLRDVVATGVIDGDYFTFKGKEHYEKFDTGIAGMFIDGASAANVNERMVSFAANNPDKDPSNCIGLATLVGPDGRFHGQQNILNYWGALLFRPDLDDETFNRILSILDYVTTPEGQRLIHAGIEGVDYTMENGELTIIREKDANGAFVYMGDKYPSYNFFFAKAVLADDWSSRDPSLPVAARERAVNMFRVKEKITDLNSPDYDFIFFKGEKKLRFGLAIDGLITDMVLSKDTIDTLWAMHKAENEAVVNGVIDELNSTLVK